jgi:hypothetical protein
VEVQIAWNQADAPLLLESFLKRPRMRFEASQFGGSHKYKTKQKKIPSLIDGYSCWFHYSIGHSFNTKI